MNNYKITIHPYSALAGMALLGLVWVTAGAMPLQGSSSTRDVSAIEVVSDPHPRDFVTIMESTPFTVPAGRILVITGMGGSASGNTWVTCTVNGSAVIATFLWSDTGHFQEFSDGLTALAGDVVSMSSSTSANTGVILGYLVDA